MIAFKISFGYKYCIPRGGVWQRRRPSLVIVLNSLLTTQATIKKSKCRGKK